jgi:uncharacterized protein (DUF1697 family)
MADLKEALTEAGLTDVRTYIQSGNVLFTADERDDEKLGQLIKQTILQRFSFTVDVAVFSEAEWRAIIKAAPAWWGQDKTWKHNLLIMIKPFTMEEVMGAFEGLKPEIESVEAGKGVVYESVSLEKFGRTKTSRLVMNPVYKKMTIRNYNTATKLLLLLEAK